MAVKKREHERARDVLVSNIDGQGKETFDWKRIWKLPLPNKVRMFIIWRLAHNSLAVHKNIARRGVKRETICPMCWSMDEDCGHLFFKCHGAKEVWRMQNLKEIRKTSRM